MQRFCGHHMWKSPSDLSLQLPFIAGNTRLLLLRPRKITLFEMSDHQKRRCKVQSYIFTFVAFEVAPRIGMSVKPKECLWTETRECIVEKVKFSLSYSLQRRNLLLHCRTRDGIRFSVSAVCVLGQKERRECRFSMSLQRWLVISETILYQWDFCSEKQRAYNKEV